MSLANDLLKALSVDEDDKTLVIDHYTRSIIIPKSITTLGVESDDDVFRLDFRMPRYLGTVDLSKFSIRVNYINAKGDDGFYKVTDAHIVGDNVLFSWLVGPTATAYKGITRFNVDMVVTDSQSTILNEYNTAVASLPVLEGLEVEADTIMHYTDILEQWERRLFGAGDTAESAIEAASLREQDNIAHKGAEVLATIPADYTTAVRMTDNADRTKADAIICYAEGETVKIEDSSDDYLRGLKLFGKTEQVKTNGHQLYDASWFDAKSGGGATITNNGDGSFTVSGSGTMTASLSLAHTYTHEETVKLLTAGYIYLNAEVCTYPYAYAYVGGDSGYTEISNIRDDMKKTTITQEMLDDESTILRIGFYSQTGGTIKPGTFKPVLHQDGDGTFEPYSGGVASPSPEWPQELVCIENPTVDVYGKNLLNITATTQTTNGITFTITDDKTVVINGTATADAYCVLTQPFVLNPGKYVLSGCTNGSSSTYFLYSDTGAIYSRNSEVEFTIDTPSEKKFLIKVHSGITVNNVVVKPMLRLAKVDDNAYEAPSEAQQLPLTRTFSGVPVTSGGNYTDANGQQWACDEIDFERGVYVQRIGHHTFTGSESWGEGTSVLNGMHRYYTWLYDMRPDNSGFGLCNYYPRTPLAVEQIDSECVRFGQSNVTIFFFSPTITNVNDWAAHVASLYDAGKPIKVQYVLTTPIETALTASEISEFKKLHTNYPTTTVFNDAGATMRVTYNADTKTYLDNCFRPTDEQVQAAVDAWLTAHFTTAEGVSF